MAKRRGHGEGTIYQSKGGRWRAQITLPDGRRRSKSHRTRREANMWLAKVQNAISGGLNVAPERLTLEAYLTRWITDTVSIRVRPRTVESYESIVRVHLIPALGDYKLHELRPDHIQALITEKLASGLSPRTVQYIHAVLKRALKQAVKWGLVARNVADIVDGPRSRRRPMTVLTPDQVKQFLESVRGSRLYALYVLAISTGMRQGELLGLRWDDVDLEAGMIHISSTLQVTSEGASLAEPKTPGSRRTIALTPATVAILRMHRKNQLQERLLAGGRWEHEEMVFTTKRGTYYNPSNIVHYFHAALERAGLPRIRFHDLRHTAATLLLVKGVHPKVVSDMLGHADIGLTLDTYSHILPSMQEEAARVMQSILFNDGQP